MRKHFISILLVILLPFSAAAFSGCSTARHLTQKVNPADTPDLKKQIAVMPFETVMGPEWGTGYQISDALTGLLENYPGLLIFRPDKGESLFSGENQYDFNVPTSPEIFKKAEDLGINALVTGVLYQVETRTAKKGIWPFRKYVRVFEIFMSVNVQDVISRVLLLSSLESREIPVKLDETDGRKDEDFAEQVMKEAMAGILKKQAAAVSKALAESPFTGRILAVEPDGITINIGKATGLKPGKYFEVFGRGETILSGNGQTITLLGNRIGEIKVTSVMEKYSLAVPEGEGDYLPGLAIRYKR